MSSINFSNVSSGASVNPTDTFMPVNNNGVFEDSQIQDRKGIATLITDSNTVELVVDYGTASIRLGCVGVGYNQTSLTVDDNNGALILTGAQLLNTPLLPVLSGLKLTVKINGVVYYVPLYTES